MSGTGPLGGLLRLATPLVPLTAYYGLLTASGTRLGSVGLTLVVLAMVALLCAVVAVRWRRGDAAAARLGGPVVRTAFRDASRTADLPEPLPGDRDRWRAETDRTLADLDTEAAGLPWFWVTAAVLAVPVLLSRAVGWDLPLLITLLPLIVLAAWPVLWWDTVRRRDRLRRLALRLG